MPDVRLPLSEYYDEDPGTPDKLYQKKASLIDGYSFNWKEKKIPKKTFESTDLVHWLTLDTALDALKDAGYTKDKLPKNTTGVIVGNTLTGEITRSNQMSLRWPYVRKVLKTSLQSKGLLHHFNDLESVMEAYYKSVFHETNEDSLAGGLANTIAGRVCNFLDVHGGGFIVDGACSSSLLAVCTAANFLSLGQMDLAIAGGVDISLDTFELIGFSKTGALTRDEMRVYDKLGKGFLPGEGCGVVILKRLEDAVKDGDQIYATLNGWGISSDGKGGITAPSSTGQSIALMRAYEMADFNPKDLSFIEGHGTGTAVGDKTELEGIAIALNSQGELPARNCGVTSFKSIVGHTKAAAGVGAFIKTVIAVNQRILPPTAGFKEPNPVFASTAKCVYALNHGQVKDPRSEIFAGVSAMGFGGINSHTLLQSYGEPSSKLKTSLDESKLFVSNQETEIFIFSARTSLELKYQVAELMTLSKGISYAELADLAKHWNLKIDQNLQYRASIVASVPFELERKLSLLFNSLTENIVDIVAKEEGSVLFGRQKEDLKIGAVFPGQGSQKINTSRRLIQRHSWLKEIFESAEKVLLEEGIENIRNFVFCDIERLEDEVELLKLQEQLKQTDLAQPAIILSSLIWVRYLERLGIKFHSVLGHSLGELMSFYVAGLLDSETLLRFAAFRGSSMSKLGSGGMLSLLCSREKAEQYIKQVPFLVSIANINAPEQTVLSGETEGIKKIFELAERDGVTAKVLPVSAAFHSKLVEESSREIQTYSGFQKSSKKILDVNLISSHTSERVDRAVDLNEYFSKQAIGEVNFFQSILNLKKECDLIVEVGPSRVLSGLGAACGIQVLPLEAKPDDDVSLNVFLANYFVFGGQIRMEELYVDRLIKSFTPTKEKEFIVNPLEKPFPDSLSEMFPILENAGFQVEGLSQNVLNDYMESRGEFIKEVILADINSRPSQIEEKFNIKKVVKLETRETPLLQESVKKASIEVSHTQKAVLDLIVEKTGFSLEDIKPEMRLLDDLNMDSIKAGSFISDIAKLFGLQGKFESSKYANSSLKEIVELVESFNSKVSTIEMSTPNNVDEVKDFVYDLLVEKTGFSIEDISSEMRLLDDLNMDSIKAGSFIAEISKRFNLQNVLKASEFANGRIADIIEAARTTGKPIEISLAKSNKVEEISDVDVKVQSFVSENQFETLREKNQSELFLDGLTLISCSANHNEVAVFTSAFEKYSKKVEIINFVDLNHIKPSSNKIVVFIPSSKGEMYVIQETVSLFTSISVYSANNNCELYFVQIGDESIISSLSFASSLHLERPSAKIKSLKADRAIDSNKLAEIIVREINDDAKFSTVYFDQVGRRYKKVYKLAYPEAKPRENLNFTTSDVVLVTGGGKGITAECALAFASKFGSQMALVGSSKLSPEIQETLNKYKKLGLKAEYFECDITDAKSTLELVGRINSSMGQITCIIHGAGMNKPRRSEQVPSNEALKEISPKLFGAINLINSIFNNPLKAFIGLTSIIGVTGMQGNSWYAFSNEALDLLLRNLKQKTGIETLTLAYSVWDEVGMGARMGSTKTLAKMGIGSISPSEGIAEFLFWIDNYCNDQQVVIAAGLGGLDTWNVRTNSLEGRYLEKILEFKENTKLISEVTLSTGSDKYLDDHNFNGSLLFPTVFGLEAMVQNAAKLLGVKDFSSVRLENITLLRPIVVSNRGETIIQIESKVDLTADGQLKVLSSISTEESNFTVTHFSAEIIFNNLPKHEKLLLEEHKDHLPIEAKTDLYSWLLFQGELFQNIDKIFELEESKAFFSINNFSTDTSELCFSSDKVLPFLLGSPLSRDLMLQAAQLVFTDRVYLPIRIKSWEIWKDTSDNPASFIKCNKVSLSEDIGTSSVYLTDKNGAIIEKIEGYEVKALMKAGKRLSPPQIVEQASSIASSITSLNEYLSKFNLDFAVFKNDKSFNLMNGREERHYVEQQIFNDKYIPNNKLKLKSVLNSLTWSKDNKPLITNSNLNISISHSRSLLAFSVGESAQGCDLEFVEKRSLEEWEGLLGKEVLTPIKDYHNGLEDIDLTATRVWCVKEAVFKATGSLPSEISIANANGSETIFNVGMNQVITLSIELWPENLFVVAVVIPVQKSSAIESEKIVEDRLTVPFDAHSGQFIHEFSTTFKDCKGLYGKTYFTNIPLWMGHLRELVLRPVAKQLLENFMTGEYGMVTNDSSIRIYDETETLEPISAKMTITDKSDFSKSFIDLHFKWFKHNLRGEQVLLAESNLSTTWVKIVGHGLVKLDPLPAYFLEYLQRYVSSVSAGLTDVENNYPSHSDLGKILYQSTSKVRPEFLVSKEYYQTGLIDGNSVGNLYYSNYYDWQAKNIERLVYRLAPETFLSMGRSGEYLCLEAVVNHLQEAMPFEEIHVNMYLQELYQNGFKLFFEYFSVTPDGKQRKLAYGFNSIIWAKRANEFSSPKASVLPGAIMNFFNNLIGQNISTVSA
jgi:acyl transferase domain-containing protein/NAD(P)-dependent dehydrogenase (short-subunit alcohol dehydrogenase family)/acyl carrier protein/phosphopantetheinyl transferase